MFIVQIKKSELFCKSMWPYSTSDQINLMSTVTTYIGIPSVMLLNYLKTGEMQLNLRWNEVRWWDVSCDIRVLFQWKLTKAFNMWEIWVYGAIRTHIVQFLEAREYKINSEYIEKCHYCYINLKWENFLRKTIGMEELVH